MFYDEKSKFRSRKSLPFSVMHAIHPQQERVPLCRSQLSLPEFMCREDADDTIERRWGEVGGGILKYTCVALHYGISSFGFFFPDLSTRNCWDLNPTIVHCFSRTMVFRDSGSFLRNSPGILRFLALISQGCPWCISHHRISKRFSLPAGIGPNKLIF